MTFYDMTWLERLLFLKRIKGGGWISEIESVPYNYRPAPDLGHEYKKEYDEIVGASVGWNQLAETISNSFSTTSNATVTKDIPNNSIKISGSVPSGKYAYCHFLDFKTSVINHIYIIGFKVKANTLTPTKIWTKADNNGVTINTDYHGDGIYWTISKATTNGQLIVGATYADIGSAFDIDYTDIMETDLTRFNSAIADYVYSLEQSTAGSGVAWLKSHFPKLFDNGYMSYDSGSIKSVSGLTAHVMCDANDNIIGNYPLDSSVTLRGQYKLDANNQLYADGDVYPSSGEIGRNWSDEIDLGSLAWTYNSTRGWFRANLSTSPYDYGVCLCSHYPFCDIGRVANNDKVVTIGGTGLDANRVIIKDTTFGSDVNAFKTSLQSRNVTLTYKLATPTTETATPYTNPQWCDSKGTEEYVGSELPVGHNTQYPMSLVDTMPTTNGTFEPRVTVTNGVRAVTWVSV